ncbi:hypothetical protein [Clostridium scatologenes]|uniref:Uncharacterized protein n=1 Tax=Clostridium scatologenes TaxID=1548 RepID=A0A0E3M894_CLOSL|nr:hypothetical protein [Clostridium scatologenes]AKA68522.1 hypothetical protein CSCA_1397 [Clostridium scatologenes]
MEFKFEIEIESSKLTLDKYFKIVMKMREYTKEKVTYMDGNDYIFTSFGLWYYSGDSKIEPCITLYCNDNKDLLVNLIKNYI